jgi:phosphatidate phosphatase LPIN
VVISDIDGTITKSDALGHLFTMVGKDWTHVGVASLYSKIAKNGYEFLYLTSRAIGQAASTRGYLKGVEQDRFQLPDGPVIMSPDRLFTALHREVIQRRPDEFKIACLRDIQRLFVDDEESVDCMGSGVISSSEDEGGTFKPIPKITVSTAPSAPAPAASSKNPFYAGFGNRPTDTKSYKAVGISASRIFLINPTGDLKLDRLTFFTPYWASSYAKLTEEVDKVFPPLLSPQSLVREAGDEAFTDFQYWSGSGDINLDLVNELLGGKPKQHKPQTTSSSSSGEKQQEIMALPSGEGLVALTEVSLDEGALVAAVADSRVIISSPGRRRSESASRMMMVQKRLSLSLSVEGDEADAEVTESEESEESEEGTSVNSITSYPFM